MRQSAPSHQGPLGLALFLLMGGVVPLVALLSIVSDLSQREGLLVGDFTEDLVSNDVSAELRRGSVAGTVEAGVKGSPKTKDLVVDESEVVKRSERPANATKTKAPETEQRVSKQAFVFAAPQRSVERDHAADILREAQALALRMDDPWVGLIEVARQQDDAGLADEASATFELAISLADDPDDYQRSRRATLDVVRGLIRAGRLTRADALARSAASADGLAQVSIGWMKAADTEAAISTVLLIGDARVRDRAFAKLTELEAGAQGLGEVFRIVANIHEDRTRYGALERSAVRLAQGGQSGLATKLVAAIIDVDRRDEAYTKVVRAHLRKARMADAEAALAMIVGVTAREVAMGTIAEARAKVGDATARGVALSISDDHRRRKTLLNVAKTEAQRGDTRAALATTISIDELRSRDVALREVAVASVKADGADRARSLVSRIGDQVIRDEALANIAVATLREHGDDRDALSTARMVQRPEARARSLAQMAAQSARRGDQRGAERLLTEAVNVSNDATDIAVRDQDALSVALAEAYGSTHQPDLALQLAEDVTQVRQRDRVMSRLSADFTRERDYSAALNASERIDREADRDKARQRVIEHYAKSVRPEEAVRRSHSLPTRRDRVAFLVAVASSAS